MNLRAERRERIAEFISCERYTTTDGIFYALQGTDYEVTTRTIWSDLQYLMYEKNYGIYIKNGGRDCGVYAERDWYYSQPISSKDILVLSRAIKLLPLDVQKECEEIVERIKRIKEF